MCIGAVWNLYGGNEMSMKTVETEKSAIVLPDAAVLKKLAVADAAVPVAPGTIGGAPFWNEYAVRFISVPSFPFAMIKGAAMYQFTVLDAGNKVRTFTESRPDAPLSKVWNDLPVGFTTVSVSALDNGGKIIGDSGVRKFYRAAVFSGDYAPKVRDYRASAKWALEYIFNKSFVQHWRTAGKPDPAYDLYCYPSKIIAALVQGMIKYSELEPAKRAEALEIARRSADHLIAVSQPAGAPLEYMPPTYAGTARTAGTYANQNMMIYPAEAGEAYLALYKVCGDKKYLDAAIRIADTYCKLQLECGSWYLKINEKDGSVVKPAFNETPIGISGGNIAALENKPNKCVPVRIIEFMLDIYQISPQDKYLAAAQKAEAYIRENVQKPFNWEGQFEDMFPTRPYANNTKHTAADFALFLLTKKELPPGDQQLTRTLLRFAEDQFTVWSDPRPAVNLRSKDWKLPCALEQYSYYIPIDASAAKMLAFFTAMHRRYGQILDLAKASALADAVTRGQDQKTGRYMTYWENNWRSTDEEGWINCAIYTASAMCDFADHLDRLSGKK